MRKCRIKGNRAEKVSKFLVDNRVLQPKNGYPKRSENVLNAFMTKGIKSERLRLKIGRIS